MRVIYLMLLMVNLHQAFAQSEIITDGRWSGVMKIYKANKVMDTVSVELTIRTIVKDSVWQWKTEYLSTKMPVIKDYLLKVQDRTKGIYITDEQDGTELLNFLIGNKMYCQFEIPNMLLTSSYEWRGNEIIFEITAGKKTTEKKEIINYTVNTLQTVTLKKIF